MFKWSFSTVRCLVIVCGTVTVLMAIACLHRFDLRQNTADAILKRADDLAWKNRWLDAQPLYAKAQCLYEKEHQPSLALYAQVSQFIPRAESEDISSLLLELQQDQSLPAAQEPETELRILTIQGMIETNYDASMASKTWKRVQVLAKQQHQYRLMMRAVGEQGIAAFLLGDLTAAKKLVVRAWLSAKYLGDPAAQVRYASVYGAGMVALHRYQEAISTLNEAIATASHARGLAYPSIAINSKIDALRGLHRYPEALALADEAITRLPRSRLDAHLFQLLTSKGEIYEDMGRWRDAELQYALALDYARYLDYWRGITQTGGLLARVYVQEDQLHQALASVDMAIAANHRLPRELYFVPGNLAVKAQILERMGRRRDAEALYVKSAALVDSLIATAPTPGVEAQLITDLSTIYSGNFELLFHEQKYARAFEVVEEARGRIVAQALEHRAALPPHTPTTQEKQITQLNLELLDTEDPAARARILKALYESELQPDDGSLEGRTATHPVALKTLQRDLRPQELLIEYLLADPHSYALAVAHDSVRVYVLSPRQTIEQQVSQYRSILSANRTDTTLAGTLFDELLRPIPEYRRKASIILVADGNLHLLLFAALADNGSYTMLTHAFTAAPSATVLDILRHRSRTRRTYARTYLAVAASTQAQAPGNSILHRLAGLERDLLTPLPDSLTEANAVARLLPPPGTLLLGEAATETAFRRLPLDQYEVLHLAVHGYINLEYPDRSALVFAPQVDPTDDGLLEVREIRRMHLTARLVTLSSCNAGVGPVGESGVSNLVNAFLEAGAGTVVSTLWDVDDVATAHLMEDFYTGLSRHESMRDALRTAKLDAMRAGLSPYYWASFEAVGEPGDSI